MQRIARNIGVVMAAGVILATTACGSNSDTATAPPATLGTTAPPTVPKAQIIEKGDKICAEGDAKNKALTEPTSAAGVEPYLKQSLAILRNEITQIKALGTPDTDAAKLNSALDKANAGYDTMEKKIPQFVANPSSIKSDTEVTQQLKVAGDEAKAFGFKVCGKDSAAGAGSTTSTVAKK